jgi:hypothetical protein
MSGFWQFVFAIAAIVLLGWLNGRIQARRSGSGSLIRGAWQIKRQPGMEATDVEGFNDALNRNAAWGEVPQELQGLGRRYGAAVASVKDDETYAARYHGAFGKTEIDK